MKNTTAKDLPILLKEDTQLFNSMLSGGKRLYSTIGEISIAYEKMKIGPFTNEVYTSLISGGIGRVESQLISDVTNRFDALNLRSDTMRNEVISSAYALITPLKSAVDKLQHQARNYSATEPSFPLGLISIKEDGSPEITAQSQDQLKEQFCRYYLTTPDELALYTKLQNVADSCNELMALFTEHKGPYLPAGAGNPQAVAMLIHAMQEEGGRLSIKPGFATWAVKQYQA